LQEQRDARRATIDRRVEAAARLASNGDPWLIWCELNAEGDAFTRAISDAVQVAGADSREDKEERMLGFAAGKYRVLVTKPTVAGYGMNWQHCAHVAFVGVSHSYEQFYQAVRRCWRYGQTKPVTCHVIRAENEGRVVANLRRKEADAERMAAAMLENMLDIQNVNVRGTSRIQSTHMANDAVVIPSWMVSEP
jgi:superfamily II DNA or RNA helicase